MPIIALKCVTCAGPVCEVELDFEPTPTLQCASCYEKKIADSKQVSPPMPAPADTQSGAEVNVDPAQGS